MKRGSCADVLVGVFICWSWGVMSGSAYAQTATDALRWSFWLPVSTARGTGVALSMSGVGANPSVLIHNPAGLGIYRKGDFMFTPVLSGVSVQTSYGGEVRQKSLYSFGVANIALVTSTGISSSEEGWVSFSWALGLHRLQDFNRQMVFAGESSSGTFLQTFQMRAEGTPPSQLDPFSTGLAYQTGLLTVDTADTTHYQLFFPSGWTPWQEGVLTERGSLSEVYMAFAGNYENKLLIGFSVEVPFMRYLRTYSLRERDMWDSIPGYQEHLYEQRSRTTGWGLGFRFGVLYWLPVPVRLGFFLQSPRILFLRDQYSAYMEAGYDSAGVVSATSPDGRFEYRFITPWKAGVSFATILGQVIFLSASYAFTDYRSMYFEFPGGAPEAGSVESSVNEEIAMRFGPSHELRIGSELRMDWFRIRVGIGWITSPLAGSNSYQTTLFTAGMGILEDDFYLDFAGMYFSYPFRWKVYAPVQGTAPVVEATATRLSFLFTVGWRFE